MEDFFLIPFARAGVITDAPSAVSILGRILDFLLSIVGIIAILGLVVAGILYLTAAGDERRAELAKRMAIACVIGLVVTMGAAIIVSQLAAFFS